MIKDSIFHGPNLGYILDLYDQYLDDPDAVDKDTRNFFHQWIPKPDLQTSYDQTSLISAANLAQAIRERGYLAAKLNPLSNAPIVDPSLTLEFHDIQPSDLRQLPADVFGLRGENAYQGIDNLRSIFCKTIGYDYGHIRNKRERQWLYQSAETRRFRTSIDEIKLLERLTQIEAFEQFLHRIYPGKTRFSIEGLDMMIPMLDEIITGASDHQICAILIGMAHRGRLNVLAHVLQKPYNQIFAEFMDPEGRATTWDELGWTGDVKYHMGGYRSPKQTDHNIDLMIRMPANPSHLELIDPFLQGMARAADEAVDCSGEPQFFENASLPILVHGDASFTGQGIVAETFNLSRLHGYTTGGSLHIIANNQLGFTADEDELRSSLHASDLAKGFEIPVIHVNADDPKSCLEAARTAFAYRQEFHKDFVINLIGYRRHGHNEGDEPRFTQPLMYQTIDEHLSVRKQWAEKTDHEDQAEEMLRKQIEELQAINKQLDPEKELVEPVPQPPPRGVAGKINTSLPIKHLKTLNQELLKFPEEFQLNSKLKRSIEKRRNILQDGANKIDWATAEELAFASILQEGISIRLTGEDSARGTFSQRHAVFHDIVTQDKFIPLQTFPQAKAAFTILNSPLTEAGAVGFECGYNVQAPERLVLWEAQYGDFINNAQSVIDEFLLAGRAKWGLTPSLVLLLPHGNEGMGPDHSSGRIERFLGLAAEINVRIAYPSNAAQYFHLLRRQALLLETDPLPLVVFTPKGTLRHPLVASPARNFMDNWQQIIDDQDLPADRDVVINILLCSGRIYFDLVASDLREKNPDDAIVRVEQLYPYPQDAMSDVLIAYPNLQRVIWVQEEPKNMGAWNYIRQRMRQQLSDNELDLHYVGRPESSSPSEGSSTLYRLNQKTLIKQAFEFEKQTVNQSVIKERG